MAASPSAENSALFDSAENSRSANTQPAPLDWEMLSMSTMSASTLGLPPQRLQESETAEEKDRSLVEDAIFDASIEPFTASPQDVSKKDMEHENMQAPVGLPHEALVGAEASTIQEEGIPAVSSKKKKIRVFWSKHQVLNWQPPSRKYGAVLSIALVAAVVGIAFIGHRLRRERNLNHQLRLEVASKEEKLSDLMYQVNRMKEAMTGRRRIGVTRNSFF